ncbi:MAG: hypothetical protein ACRD6X_12320 [Pyrinomonadaceae bacterium]
MFHSKNARYLVWLAAALVIAAGLNRYLYDPTFWLDEAFVSASLRSPTFESIFAPHAYGQFFPRFYFSLLAVFRDTFGYHEWVLRLIPFTCFVIATLIWARILSRAARSNLAANFLAAALLLGTYYWMDQAIQLKQYTFDVMFALLPFLLKDNALAKLFTGEKKPPFYIYLLAVPCALSYTYPIALGGRMLGWLILNLPQRSSIRYKRVAVFGIILVASLATIWLIDVRFNFTDIGGTRRFWSACILIECSVGDPWCWGNILARFLWGWHGRYSYIVPAIIAPFQLIGIYSIARRLITRRSKNQIGTHYSLALGSLVVLAGAIAASLIASYPICAGRLTLFVQIHTQIVAIAGLRFALVWFRKNRTAKILIVVCITVILFGTVRAYVAFVQKEPHQNMRPFYSKIDPTISNTIWVHSCSATQVKSLSTPLPVENILFSPNEKPEPGQRVWVIWTHLQNEECRGSLDTMLSQMKDLQMVEQGEERTLAIGEYCCVPK